MQSNESDSSDSAALAAALAEYEALRAEIAWLLDHSVQLQNFAVALFVGIVPIATFLLDKNSPAVLVGILLSLPIAFSILGLLYFRQHQEVFVVAAYIKHAVRPIIRELAGREDLWTWEEYKAKLLDDLSAQSPIFGAWRPPAVLMLRLAMFILPAAVALLLAVSIALAVGLRNLNDTYTLGGTFVLLIFAIVDVLMMGVLTIRFVRESDLGRIVLDSSELVLPGER